MEDRIRQVTFYFVRKGAGMSRSGVGLDDLAHAYLNTTEMSACIF